jgi:hypothetical protein
MQKNHTLHYKFQSKIMTMSVFDNFLWTCYPKGKKQVQIILRNSNGLQAFQNAKISHSNTNNQLIK